MSIIAVSILFTNYGPLDLIGGRFIGFLAVGVWLKDLNGLRDHSDLYGICRNVAAKLQRFGLDSWVPTESEIQNDSISEIHQPKASDRMEEALGANAEW